MEAHIVIVPVDLQGVPTIQIYAQTPEEMTLFLHEISARQRLAFVTSY
jgi:hypothetical protein